MDTPEIIKTNPQDLNRHYPLSIIHYTFPSYRTEQIQEKKRKILNTAKARLESAHTANDYITILQSLSMLQNSEEASLLCETCNQRMAQLEQRKVRISAAIDALNQSFQNSLSDYRAAYETLQSSKNDLEQAQKGVDQISQRISGQQNELLGLKGLFFRQASKGIGDRLRSSSFNQENRKHLPTEYALSKGASKPCWGWLWPVNAIKHQSDIVTSAGGFSLNHINRIGAVRPAIWIDSRML